MSRSVFLVLLAAILCSVLGQFSLKAGAKILGPIGTANLMEKVVAMATQPLILGGLSLYAVSSIGFIVVLSRANISIVSPLLSISYLFTYISRAFAAAAVGRRGANYDGSNFCTPRSRWGGGWGQLAMPRF